MRWLRWRALLMMMMMMWTLGHTQPADNTDSEVGKEDKTAHHRVTRQLFDGFRPSVDGISALENVDELLRSTIPTLDRFDCIQSMMCNIARTMAQTGSDAASALASAAQQPAFDPTFQQGPILDPSTIQQGFPGFVQNPAAIQQGLQQGIQQGLQGIQQGVQQGFPGFQQGVQQGVQGFPGFAQQNPAAAIQPGLQQGAQQLGLQQGAQQLGLQQGAQQLGLQQSLQQGLQQGIQLFPNPGAPLPNFGSPITTAQQGSQGGLQGLLGGTGFQNLIPNFRSNPDTHARSSPANPAHRTLRRRRPGSRRRRPQRRSGFLGFLNRLGRKKRSTDEGDGRSGRTKRNIIEDLFGTFTSTRFMGLLDQMMTSYSFYPYTHAAYMGYTGGSEMCEKMYASCPNTPEEMIDVFNNIHRHFPNGIPFRDSMPWPLNVLLP